MAASDFLKNSREFVRGDSALVQEGIEFEHQEESYVYAIVTFVGLTNLQCKNQNANRFSQQEKILRVEKIRFRRSSIKDIQ